MKTFLNALVSDMRIADAIAQQMPALLGLLCVPHCRLIQPIRIDLDTYQQNHSSPIQVLVGLPEHS